MVDRAPDPSSAHPSHAHRGRIHYFPLYLFAVLMPIPASSLSWPKKALFGSILALGFLIVAFGTVELGLRLFGYGHAPGFWKKEEGNNGRSWIRENWWVTAPFFAPELVRRPQPFRLTERKTATSYRVFVLGSSAAMGDPEPSFSISRVLEVMLHSAYPKIDFEVVNAAITAINSHVVRGIAQDCAKLEPDLFFVYEGNNEVIGPFGPGTVFTPFLQAPWAVRSAIYLRGLRTGQALTALARKSGRASGTPEEWGGMQMFLQHEIASDDPRLGTTERMFEANLRAIARAGTEAGATVIFGTVLTNQKDFSPFLSRHRANFDPAQLAQWTAAFTAGSAASTTADWEAAERDFRAAVAADGDFAESHFQLGRVLLRVGRAPEAKAEFQRALDQDVLRFRTDSRLNDAIRRVAGSAGKGVELVDLVRAAEAKTPGGILGDEMLYEHVHLSFRGTYIVASELFRTVTSDLRRRGRLSEQDLLAAPLSADEVRAQLAFTTYEQAMIGKEMLARLKRAPFTSQSTNDERIAGFSRRDARASQLLEQPESAGAIFSIYEQAIARQPKDWILHRNYGMALVAMNRAAPGKAQLLKALEIIPDDPDTVYALILAHRQLDEKSDAARRTEELRKLAPNFPGLEERK